MVKFLKSLNCLE